MLPPVVPVSAVCDELGISRKTFRRAEVQGGIPPGAVTEYAAVPAPVGLDPNRTDRDGQWSLSGCVIRQCIELPTSITADVGTAPPLYR